MTSKLRLFLNDSAPEHRLLSLLPLIISLGVSNVASAAEEDTTTLVLGAGATYSPGFEGADDYEFGVVPLISVANFYGFNFEFAKLSYNLVDFESASGGWVVIAGPLVGYAAGRDQDDHRALNGLGDVDDGVEVGAFASVGNGRVTFNADIRTEVGDGHSGTQLTLGVGTAIPFGDRFRLLPSVSTTWSDDEYMQSFFGIGAAQSLRSGYRRFDAGAGFKDVTLGLSASYGITERLELQGGVAYSRLLGDAADSPLVMSRDGSADQYGAMIGLAYAFEF